jgi:cystathionine beta-synthase
MVLADPMGSILAEYVNTGKISLDAGSWLVEGIGEDFIPPMTDFSLTRKAYSIKDKESFYVVRELLRKEGILAGSSTGTLLSAALKYCNEQKSPKRVVTFACDSGNKYLSKMYNDFWMYDQGFKKRRKYGDLRDLISRRFEENEIIFVNPHETLNTVYQRMKKFDISQIPVLIDKKIVGIVDESDLLTSLKSKNQDFSKIEVEKIMSTDLRKLQPNDSYDQLIYLLFGGFTAIIEDKNGIFKGLITKIDLINYLRSGDL